jgi:type VI secretion system secreted protein VgrG
MSLSQSIINVKSKSVYPPRSLRINYQKTDLVFINKSSNTYLTLRVTHEARNNFSADLAHAIDQLVGSVAPLTDDKKLNLINSLSNSVQSPASAAPTAPGSGVMGSVGGAVSGAVGQAMRGAAGSVLGGIAKAPAAASHQKPDSKTTPLSSVLSRQSSDQPTQYYRNQAELIPASVRYKPLQQNGHGQLLHPKPTIMGTQTAVVMSDGSPLFTDRDHRIKVQFHWQRGQNSASRNSHPSPVGNDADNAPANEAAGTWVRVATPVAGSNWGSHFIPRAGQEVLVAFMHGDIDRPVVIGSVYNGVGSPDAQSNQVGSGAATATGNASAWFAGESGDHAHNAVLAGIKTQSLDASQSGDGGYNQLVFDDSPGQARSSLMSTQAHSQLNLGHAKHQHDNARKASLGHGAELTTQGAAALRAGQGLLLSTDAKPNASGQQMDSREASAQIDSSQALAKALIDTAQKQNAKLKAEPAPDKLPVMTTLDAANQAISTSNTGSDSEAGGAGMATAYSDPHIQFSSPDGIVALTPKDAILSAGNVLSLIAGQDINILATNNYVTAIKEGLSIFTYGKASNPNKPNQETGIQLHAASGSVSVQAQSDQATLTADKHITLASTNDSVNIAAKGHVLLTAGGGYIKLEGGNIEIHAPGMVLFKATAKELAGPVSIPGPDVKFDIKDLTIKSDLKVKYEDASGNALTGESLEFTFADGSTKQVSLDGNGKAELKKIPRGPVTGKQPKEALIKWLHRNILLKPKSA